MDDRINIRSVESQDRFDELQAKGHQNLVLTGFTKLDPLFDLDDDEISLWNQIILSELIQEIRPHVEFQDHIIILGIFAQPHPKSL